jgi:hypothetical protein
MAHEIFGDRFLDRKAAWHDVGHQCVAEKLRALPALKKIGGDFNVSVRPLFFYDPNDNQQESGFHQIVRFPTPDDNEFVPLGQPVTLGYTPFLPRDVCAEWDAAMPPDVIVETMGILRRGAMFFITTKLPTIDVKGDEVERYLGVTSPLDGITALSAEEWPLRVVCANTLRAAQAGALASFHVQHRGDGLKNIGKWLAYTYDRAVANSATLKRSFEALAKARVDDDRAKIGIERIYPLTPPSRADVPKEIREAQAKRYEVSKVRVFRLRSAAFELFAGAGTGLDHPAAKNTAWGFLQAVTELEDYRRGSPVGSARYRRARESESALYGTRAQAKERAMIEALAMAGIGRVTSQLGHN